MKRFLIAILTASLLFPLAAGAVEEGTTEIVKPKTHEEICRMELKITEAKEERQGALVFLLRRCASNRQKAAEAKSKADANTARTQETYPGDKVQVQRRIRGTVDSISRQAIKRNALGRAADLQRKNFTRVRPRRALRVTTGSGSTK